MVQRIGHLFPLGGPVPPGLMIGRVGERDELVHRLAEGMSTMLTGPRRAGKTTVCEAACSTLASRGFMIFHLEVPERADSKALLQLIVDRATRMSLSDEAGTIARTVRPAIEKWLGDHGVPLDLGALDAASGQEQARAVLALPIEIARRRKRPMVLFLDEMQRVVSYGNGHEVVTDLVDLYRASGEVVVLVDGSEERALDEMFGAPLHFGKLADRQRLDPKLPATTWRGPLGERFAAAGLELPEEQCERLLTWSGGRVYPTMAAARCVAFNARRLGASAITDFEIELGLDEARRHLEDDGA